MFHIMVLTEFELYCIREQDSVCSFPAFEYTFQEKK